MFEVIIAAVLFTAIVIGASETPKQRDHRRLK